MAKTQEEAEVRAILEEENILELADEDKATLVPMRSQTAHNARTVRRMADRLGWRSMYRLCDSLRRISLRISPT